VLFYRPTISYLERRRFLVYTVFNNLSFFSLPLSLSSRTSRYLGAYAALAVVDRKPFKTRLTTGTGLSSVHVYAYSRVYKIVVSVYIYIHTYSRVYRGRKKKYEKKNQKCSIKLDYIVYFNCGL